MKPYDRLKYLSPQFMGSLINRRPAIKLIQKLQKKRILYINAPVGYGKTTAVFEWLKNNKYENTWLHLDKYDADEVEFSRNIILTLSKSFEYNVTLKDIVNGSDFYNMSLECLYFAFDSINQLDAPFVLVLDDFQFASDNYALEILNNMILRLPKNFYIVIIDESYPSLEFEKLLKKLNAARMGIDNLRFNATDIQNLLAAKDIAVDTERAGFIANQTNGCPFIINLIAQNYNYYYDDNLYQKSISDIIKLQIINNMDLNRKLFHIKVSISDVVDPAFCAYLTDIENSKDYLDDLLPTGFVVNLNNGFYRYHRLLRNALLEILNETTTIDKNILYMRAAEWEYNNKNYLKAIDYYTCIGENKLAADIVQELYRSNPDSYGVSKYAINIRKILLSKLTDEDISSNHKIIAYFAWTAFLEGDINEYAKWSSLLSHTGYINDVSGKPDKNFIRFISMINPQSNIGDVMKYFRKEAGFFKNGKAKSPPFVNFSYNMPFFHNSQIDYSPISDKAESFFEEFSIFLEEIWGSSYRLFEYVILSGIFFEKKQLNRALELAESAKSLINKNTPPNAAFCVYMMLSEIYESLGMKIEAQNVIKHINKFIESKNLYYLLPNYNAFMTSKLLMSGNRTALSNWIEKSAPKLEKEINFYNYLQHIVTVRCLTSTARFKEAILLLQKLDAFCNDFSRVLDGITVKILFSINYWNLGSKNLALEYLESALVIGQQYGYISVFSREAYDIVPILKRIANKVSRGGLPDIEKRYIKSILIHANNFEANNNGVSMTSLSGVKPKKLSKQQMLMLKCLAKGMSYMEICEETGLKITSVREHITKMYAKLSVHNSTDVILKAKELNILNDED